MLQFLGFCLRARFFSKNSQITLIFELLWCRLLTFKFWLNDGTKIIFMLKFIHQIGYYHFSSNLWSWVLARHHRRRVSSVQRVPLINHTRSKPSTTTNWFPPQRSHRQSLRLLGLKLLRMTLNTLETESSVKKLLFLSGFEWSLVCAGGVTNSNIAANSDILKISTTRSSKIILIRDTLFWYHRIELGVERLCDFYYVFFICFGRSRLAEPTRLNCSFVLALQECPC